MLTAYSSVLSVVMGGSEVGRSEMGPGTELDG